MSRCRLCSLPIVDGEDAVEDPAGYWAWHPRLHAVCADGSYQPEPEQPAVRSRAMSRLQWKMTPR